MPSSTANPASRLFDEALLALAWSLWTELGVAGVARHHGTWAVDPEALLIFTATLAERDPRLRDESLDAALQLAPYLSMGRMKALLAMADPRTVDAFADYAATFNAAARGEARFPQTQAAEPLPFRRTGKSKLGTFQAPSQVFLRLRALFGVGARADALVVILGLPHPGWFAADLAARTGLAKRVASTVLQDLARGGLLEVAAVGNRLRYDLLHRPETLALTGAFPSIQPSWSPLFRFLITLQALLQRAPSRKEVALLVDAQRALQLFQTEQTRCGLPQPRLPLNTWPEVAAWSVALAEGLARGQWEGLGVG